MEDVKTYPKIDQLSPSECISGKIMRCNRVIANIFRKHIAQFDVTDSQLSILFVIAKANHANQNKISKLLYLEKSTVNRNLNRLLQRNIISYKAGKETILTEEGKLLLNTIIPHWEKAMTEIRAILTESGENAINLLTNKLTT